MKGYMPRQEKKRTSLLKEKTGKRQIRSKIINWVGRIHSPSMQISEAAIAGLKAIAKPKRQQEATSVRQET